MARALVSTLVGHQRAKTLEPSDQASGVGGEEEEEEKEGV